MWSNSIPDVEFQYGGRLGKFNGMSSHSHVLHCRVLPLDNFTVTIPEPHATLQGVRIPSAILKSVFRRLNILFFVFNAVKRAAAFVSSPIHLLVRLQNYHCVQLIFSVLFGIVVHAIAGCDKQNSLTRGDLRDKRTSTLTAITTARSTVELLMTLH